MLRQGFNHIRIMKFQKVPQIETHKTSTHKKNHTKPQKKKKTPNNKLAFLKCKEQIIRGKYCSKR